MTWLQEEGVRTLSLRERFGALARRHDLPAAGNLLIVAMPAITSFRNDEAVALDQWVRNGNTLLILAAIADRPAWARERDVLDKDLQLLTGVEIELVRHRDHAAAKPPHPPPPAPAPTKESKPEQDAETATELIAEATQLLPQPKRGTLVPNRAHRYLAEVRSAYAFSDYVPRTWSVKVPRDGFLLALAHSRESGEGVLWVLPDGRGTMIISGFGSLFSNRALGQGDNARLLANIVAASVAPQGVVLFDDEHQGLSVTYDARQVLQRPAPVRHARPRSRRYGWCGCSAARGCGCQRRACPRRGRRSWCAPPARSWRACCSRPPRRGACSRISSSACRAATRQPSTARRAAVGVAARITRG